MAQDQNKTSTGGNKPKPGNAGGGGTGQSAKDKSRAQSRPVSGKAPTGKSGPSTGANRNGGAGGNKPKPRPAGRPAPAPAPRRLSGAMMAWGAVGLVVVIVAVLVIVKVVSGSSNDTSYTPVTAAPASIVHDVTNIPESVYNTVGVTSPTVAVTPPIIVKGQPPLTFNGQTPGMLYYGAEYCPYCAAERWAMTAALSRFGTWSGLKITASSHTDVDPKTNTFSYYGVKYTSQYLAFKPIEAVSNVPNGSGYYTTLQTPTKYEYGIVTKYESPTYIPGATAGQIGFPFISINNLSLISGPSYDPGVLAGQTWSEIAGNLSDPTNPATQAIVATANYMSASICATTKNAPASVCTSPGVEAAAKALKLS
jgi:hypothetical protein